MKNYFKKFLIVSTISFIFFSNFVFAETSGQGQININATVPQEQSGGGGGEPPPPPPPTPPPPPPPPVLLWCEKESAYIPEAEWSEQRCVVPPVTKWCEKENAYIPETEWTEQRCVLPPEKWCE